MARTVFDPADPVAHRNWAIRQEAVDQMRREGQLTSDGSLESRTSSAVRTQNVIGEQPQLTKLFGLDEKSTVSLYQEPRGYSTQRSFSSYASVPELGSVESRQSKMETIKLELRHLHPGENSIVQEEGLAILAGIQKTIEEDSLISEVRGRMSELVPER